MNECIERSLKLIMYKIDDIRNRRRINYLIKNYIVMIFNKDLIK